MAHLHAADHPKARRSGNRSRMWAALAINLGMLVAAAVGGVLTSSLALLAEAGHLLSDVSAIAIGLLAAHMAKRSPTPARTFGFHRSEILAALVNGVLLVAISVAIVVGAVSRFSDPPDVAGTGVLVLGAIGLAGNAVAAWILASGVRADINLEGVLRHSAGDALSSLGVIVAGALVLTTGWNAADPLVSLVIAALIAAGSWRLFKEPLGVLMEGAPPGIEVEEVGRAMAAEDGVVEIHDLHIWTVTAGFPALSAHLVVRPGADRDLVRQRVEAVLRDRFAILHTTLQVVEPSREGELIGVEDLRRRPG